MYVFCHSMNVRVHPLQSQRRPINKSYKKNKHKKAQNKKEKKKETKDVQKNFPRFMCSLKKKNRELNKTRR